MYDLPEYYPRTPAFDKKSTNFCATWRFKYRKYDISTFNERLTPGRLKEKEVEKVLKEFEKSPYFETGDEPGYLYPLLTTVAIGAGLFAYYITLMIETGLWWTMSFIVYYIFALSWVFAIIYSIVQWWFHLRLLKREKDFIRIARRVNRTLLADKDVTCIVCYKSLMIKFELGWKFKEDASADRPVNPWKALAKATGS